MKKAGYGIDPASTYFALKSVLLRDFRFLLFEESGA